MDQLAFLHLGGQELLIIILVFGFLVCPILALIALIQCVTAQFVEPSDRITWVLIILLVPLIGPILWWSIGINRTIRPGS